MPGIRISLHLTKFFNDHRQLVKIFIGEDLKSVKDLKSYIKELFGIEECFYLSCDNHYIPFCEDIRVINENDSIHVIPYKKDNKEGLTSKKKKRKRDEQNISDTQINHRETDSEINKNVLVKERKKKSISSCLEVVHHDSEPPTKKKRAKNIESSFKENPTKPEFKTPRRTEKNLGTASISNKKVRNSSKINVLEDKIVKNIKVNLEKAEVLGLNDVINFDKMLIGKIVNENNKMETPENLESEQIKLDSNNAKQTSKNIINTDISENDINLDNSQNRSKKTQENLKSNESMDISHVIKLFSESDGDVNNTKNLNLSETKFESWSESESTEKKQESKKQKKKSDKVKKASICSTELDKTTELETKQNVCDENIKNENPNLDNMSIWSDSQNLDLSITKTDSWTENENSFLSQGEKNKKTPISERNSIPKRKNRSFYMIHNSVGNLLANLNKELINDQDINVTTNGQEKLSPEENFKSVPKIHDEIKVKQENNLEKSETALLERTKDIKQEEDSNTTEVQMWVTKRRIRRRTRHRKSKNDTDSEITESDTSINYFQPPRTAAAPKIHKRFSDIDDDESYNCESSFSEISSQSTPHTNLRSMSIIPEEKDQDLMKTIIEDQDQMKKIADKSETVSVPPFMNCRIIFKKLKLGDNYNPVISGYIIGDIIKISKDKRIVEIKIIAGHQELEEYQGKYSLCDNTEEPQIVNTVELEWNNLIQPKLVT